LDFPPGKPSAMSTKRNYLCAEGVLMHTISKLVRMTVCLSLVPWTSLFAADFPAVEDPELLLQRIRTRITAHLSQLHNYTCHAVIDRVVRSANTGNFDHQDRVDLEVAFVGDRELFSPAGEARFKEQPIHQIVPPGMIGNDAFGSHDDDVFAGNAATFSYAGSCKKDGHKTFRYNFRVPRESKLLLLKQNDSAEAAVGYQGSFYVDAETLDMVRLEWKTDSIPPEVGLSRVEKSMRYKVVRIGNSNFSLPSHSELSSVDQKGNYHLNTTTLERCLEFTGDSIVTYGTPTDGASVTRPSTEQQQQR
jgi:hypothetical protein